MKASAPRKSAAVQVFIAIESGGLRIQLDDAVESIAWQRGADGLLTSESLAESTARLRQFMGDQAARRNVKAWCALGARGISLRRFSLPAQARENPRQLLAFQIESEFPLAPEDLAWGYVAISVGPSANPSAVATREYLVAAVKRRVIEQYQEIFDAVGLEVTFTSSAVVLGSAIPQGQEKCVVLSVGTEESEWTVLEAGLPSSTRTIPWGEAHLVDALSKDMRVDKDQAQRRLEQGASGASQNAELDRRIEQAASETLAPVLPSSLNGLAGHQLFVAGRGSILPGLASALTQTLRTEAPCRTWAGAADASSETASPAIRALRAIATSGARTLPIVLQWSHSENGTTGGRGPASMKWVALSVVLALGLVSLRYVEPLVRRDDLRQRIASMQTAWEGRPEMDHELAFLQYLQTNQPPFLEVLAAMADAAGSGTQLDSLSLNRRGEMAMKGVMPDSKVAGDFRSKLIKSGWFSSLVLEEQSPVPNQKKVNVRLSGRWRQSPGNPTPSSPDDVSIPDDRVDSEPEAVEAN